MADPEAATEPPETEAAEPDAVDAPEPEAAADEAPAPRTARRSTVRALGLLCVVFLVVAVAMAVLAANLSSKLDDERGGRRDVEQVAGRFGQALTTYDYRKLDQFRRSVFGLSTGAFHKQFDDAFPGLKELITTGKTVSRGTVKDVFVSDTADDTATAIVVVSMAVNGTSGPRVAADSYVQLDLVKSSGRWRVDGVTNLNFTNAAVPDTPSR